MDHDGRVQVTSEWMQRGGKGSREAETVFLSHQYRKKEEEKERKGKERKGNSLQEGG
jgi:hypothetical protein